MKAAHLRWDCCYPVSATGIGKRVASGAAEGAAAIGSIAD